METSALRFEVSIYNILADIKKVSKGRGIQDFYSRVCSRICVSLPEVREVDFVKIFHFRRVSVDMRVHF